MQLALDKATNDLIITDTGVARVNDGRLVVQKVNNRLTTITGEWALDPTLGLLDSVTFGDNPDLFGIEVKAREIILKTEGVQSIDSMNLVLDKRTLTLTFTATTKYGTINNTLYPWKE